MYAKSKDSLGVLELPPNDAVLKYYKFEDEKFDLRGPFRKQPLATNSMDDRPNLRYPIPWNGEEVWPEKQWQWSQKRTSDALENDELVFTKKETGWTVDYKQYLKNEEGQIRGAKLYSLLEGPYTQIGTSEIKELFGDGKVFSFPKPSQLIKHFAGLMAVDDLILDFFSGSCSTAHAILDLNQEDEGNRKFIMVQLPEFCDENSVPFKSGYNTIADIGKDRIRRVVNKIKTNKTAKTTGLGFKVFKLDSSNIRAWDPDRNDLEKTLLNHTEHLVHGRSERTSSMNYS